MLGQGSHQADGQDGGQNGGNQIGNGTGKQDALHTEKDGKNDNQRNKADDIAHCGGNDGAGGATQ